MMKVFLAFFCAAFVSCQSAPIEIPKVPNPSRAQYQPDQPDKLLPDSIEIPVFDLPDTVQEKAQAEGLALVALQNLQLEIIPRKENYRGGAVVYPYVANYVYQIFTALEKLTCVQLEPGEELVSPPASGNTDVFEVRFAYSREGGTQRAQIYIMPYLANKNTTLFINTNKRSYSFMVYSYPTIFMPLVSFSYPLQIREAMRQQIESNTDIPISGGITNLHFEYEIIPHSPFKPRWMPSLVFDDGEKTYFYFPSAVRASYAPVLFELNSKNERVIVNYRVKGTYYIVDRVLPKAELVLDVNEGNIITIRRRP
jgi:type IV secretion system protein VirB9